MHEISYITQEITIAIHDIGISPSQKGILLKCVHLIHKYRGVSSEFMITTCTLVAHIGRSYVFLGVFLSFK